MIHIPYNEEKLAVAEKEHVEAVESYFMAQNESYRRRLFDDVTGAMPYEKKYDDAFYQNDWAWLSRFLLADIETLRELIKRPDSLKFTQFKDIYSSKFSNGANVYVNRERTYNAYKFIKNLDVKVCPYCDKEYLDAFEQDGRQRRTLELDHFFSKSEYPALAMCFYNLVPSGQGCNGLKGTKLLEKSPYEMDIETHTKLCPDLPIGINMEDVNVEDCEIKFHPHKDMIRNIEVLALEERYRAHKDIAYHLLRKKQLYPNEKLEEMVRAGFFESIDVAKRDLFDEEPNPQHHILGKLKRDILGAQ